jgi:nucleotide-binding universal stress UspA family protein
MILVPTVMSPPCGWAARISAKLAQRFGSQLIFVHAGDCEPRQIEAFLSLYLEQTSHEVLVRHGDPADTILQLADELSADLIVMPTHSHGRFRRFLLGSVTAKVLHDANRPVLTGVHREDVPLHVTDFRKFVCGVDSDESFAPLIRRALDLTALFGSDLTVVHALPAADETSDNRGEAEIRKYLIERATKEFDRLCMQAGVFVKIVYAAGPVHKVLREAALRENADLVIIGRGHTQGELGRLRTHAYSVIRNSPCPVLSV